MRTEFLVLGPLVVRTAGSERHIPAAKQRALMSALLLRANHVVAVDELAELLWGQELPSAPRTGVQNHLMRLRKALELAGPRIITQPGGYLIRVDAGELDLDRFDDLLREARASARERQWQVAAHHAAAALALWRGEPLADLGSDLIRARDGSRLAELRLQAQELHIEAELQLGRHGEVTAELRELVAAHPLRERLQGLLMLALYRDSGQAEALRAYRHARSALVEELGAEPGPDLRRLHQQILAADPLLILGTTTVGDRQPRRPVPRELPADVAAFTGRVAELAALDRLLLRPRGEAATATVKAAVIAAVSGTAGVGKTALAVRWAHHAAGRFPDGQLYVNLRGYDPDQPVLATDALAGFLRSLGVPDEDIPPGETERAARYRSLLAGQRTLVVLDNASSSEQVRPLLPGTPASAVVVTSRDSLAGLVARDGARRIDLGLLPGADAVTLLHELVGARVAAEPDVASTLAEQCARLPLALRVAAELAAARPTTPLADLVAELKNEQRRLDLLHTDGDPRTAVRAVFSWSYEQLDAESARAFRLASLHPGPSLDAYAAAALADVPVERAGQLLAVLARAHLIEPGTPGRYRMHDLLRAYARELAAGREGTIGTRASIGRVLDHYLYAAASAVDTLLPAERHRRPRIPASPTATPPVSTPDAAMAWLDGERPNLVAVATHAAGSGWPGHATQMSATLYRHLQLGGHYADAVSIHAAARRAARQIGDPAAEATALLALSDVNRAQGRYRQAASQLRRALALFSRTADSAGRARALHNLGIVVCRQGDWERAARLYRAALALSGEASDHARVLNSLGTLDMEQGRYHEAADRYRHALGLFRECGYSPGVADVLCNLGRLEQRLGQYGQAANHHEEALAIFRQAGSRSCEAVALRNVGELQQRLGRYREARECLLQALTIHRETRNIAGEADARNCLGETLLADGHYAAAQRQHAIALRLASQIGHRQYEARAHDGLGHCRRVSFDFGEARVHWQQALARYAEIGAPEAGQVRARLATLDDGDSADAGALGGR